MNEKLADARATHALFVELEARQPELAQRYAWQALPAIVESGDFALADRYRGGPLALLDQVNVHALTMPLIPPPGKAPRLSADLSNLVKDARLGAAVLHGLGREAEAIALRKALLAGLTSDALRVMAQRELDDPGTIIRELVACQMAQEDAAAGQPAAAHRPNNPLQACGSCTSDTSTSSAAIFSSASAWSSSSAANPSCSTPRAMS